MDGYKRTTIDEIELENKPTEKGAGFSTIKAETAWTQPKGSSEVGVSRTSRKRSDVIATIFKIIIAMIFRRKKYTMVSVRVNNSIVLCGIVTEKGFIEMVK